MGNEGDDWIDGGPMDDVLIGDNEDPQGLSTIIAHDVLIGGTGTNQLDGENGDDIFVSGRGSNQNLGRQGFDWGLLPTARLTSPPTLLPTRTRLPTRTQPALPWAQGLPRQTLSPRSRLYRARGSTTC